MSTENEPVRAGMTFSEELKGYLKVGETDFVAGHKAGEAENHYAMFHLNIKLADVDDFVADPRHESRDISGFIRCDELGITQAAIEGGAFNLIVETPDPEVKNLFYRLYFSDLAGHPLTLSGYKVMKDDPGFDMWSDTTTLFTRIVQNHISPELEADIRANPAAHRDIIVAAGLLFIRLPDFLKELTTFRVQTEGGPDVKVKALAKFGRMFLGKLWDVYVTEGKLR
jgi:cholesterol oxidase